MDQRQRIDGLLSLQVAAVALWHRTDKWGEMEGEVKINIVPTRHRKGE